MTTRSPWIVSARFDLAAFTLPCLLALAFGAIATWTGIAGPGGQAPAWAWVLLVLGVDVAHVHGTTVRTYLDPFELRRRPALYAIAPTLGLLGGIAVWPMRRMAQSLMAVVSARDFPYIASDGRAGAICNVMGCLLGMRLA